MQKSFYFQSPVEVVKVTKDNLEEVAEWCGGKVLSCDSKHRPGTLDYYVWVPTPKGNGTSCAFPGMYVAKRLMSSAKGEKRTSWGVFRRDFFEKNYFGNIENAQKIWGKVSSEGPKPAPPKTFFEQKAEVDEIVDDANFRSAETGQFEVVNYSNGSAELIESAKIEAIVVDPEGPNHVHIHLSDEVFRSAETGQFVSEEFAQENPSTTVREEIPNASSEMVPTLGDLAQSAKEALEVAEKTQEALTSINAGRAVLGLGPIEDEILEAQNKRIDEIHGAGASEVLDEAIKDGSIFND